MLCLRRPTSLDRLPILDALHAECGCLFCELEADDELRVVEDYLRESVMDPEHRADIETNGLCRGHVHLLLGGGDVLGAAITVGAMLGTAVRAGLGDEAPSDVGVRGSRLRGLGLGALAPQGAAAARAQRQGRDCVFCRTLEGRARRRNDTFMRLYAENAEFRAEFAASRALCVPHGRQLVASASKARTLRRVACSAGRRRQRHTEGDRCRTWGEAGLVHTEARLQIPRLRLERQPERAVRGCAVPRGPCRDAPVHIGP